jgi:hypothetical protein
MADDGTVYAVRNGRCDPVKEFVKQLLVAIGNLFESPVNIEVVRRAP